MSRSLALIGAFLVAGCCITPPAAEKYFDRATPVDALKMFQYSIEAEQFDPAYDCLTAASQEILPKSRLRWLGFVKIEEMENRSLRVLLLDSVRVDRGHANGEALILLAYQEEGAILIYLALVEDEWFIDLPRTLEGLGVALELMARRIYLDHNATTPIHPEVLQEMQRVLADFPGNPSSPHHEGRQARALVEESRENVARYLRVDPGEIFFTSGGTESNNLLVHGDPSASFWTTAVEHPSLIEPARVRWKGGRSGGPLPVTASGLLPDSTLEGEDLEDAWVSIQWVNNETGVIQDVAGWTARWQARGARVHTDGAQGFFRRPERIDALGVDAATLTAHKSFGPAGVGVLFLRSPAVLEPLFQGGPQERRLRPGTETVPAIWGLGVLARIAQQEDLWPESTLATLNRRFRDGVSGIEGLEFVSPETDSAPNTVLITLDGLHAETLLVHLDRAGISASSGSACASGADRPSPVLQALGVSDGAIRGALRFSFASATRPEELDETARALETITRQLRRSSTGA